MNNFVSVIKENQLIINKLTLNNKRIISPLFEPVKAEVYLLQQTFTENLNSNFQLQFYIMSSKVLGLLDTFFKTSKDLLLEQLLNRQRKLEKTILFTRIIYLFLLSFILLAMLFSYKKLNSLRKLEIMSKKENSFIKQLQDTLLKSQSLKQICNISLNQVAEKFDVLSGVLYIYNSQTETLHLAATYGRRGSRVSQLLNPVDNNELNQKYKGKLSHILHPHENMINESLLNKKLINMEVDEQIDLGHICTRAARLLTIPLIDIDTNVAVMQLLFSKEPKQNKMLLLQKTIEIMASYIHKLVRF